MTVSKDTLSRAGGVNAFRPRLYVLMLKQDDPRRCTAAKLVRLRLVRPLFRIRQIPHRALILNPFASQLLLPGDRTIIERHGLVAIDCSWEKADEVLLARFPGSPRKLPTLLASNPTNYARQHKLSSVEALAAALYITGFRKQASQLLRAFKWGVGFLALNQEPLQAYALVTKKAGMLEAESQFF